MEHAPSLPAPAPDSSANSANRTERVPSVSRSAQAKVLHQDGCGEKVGAQLWERFLFYPGQLSGLVEGLS